MKKMLLIAGRSGSGKDAYANELENLGLKGVKSYTTRPKRYETEDSHIFVTKEEAAGITDKVATTKINGYRYFATRKQLENADFYIIDPKGIRELEKNCPDVDFTIIYIYASRPVRLERAINRGGDKKVEEKVFYERDASENFDFSAFEALLFTYNEVIIHNNNADDKDYLKREAAKDVLRFNGGAKYLISTTLQEIGCSYSDIRHFYNLEDAEKFRDEWMLSNMDSDLFDKDLPDERKAEKLICMIENDAEDYYFDKGIFLNDENDFIHEQASVNDIFSISSRDEDGPAATLRMYEIK